MSTGATDGLVAVSPRRGNSKIECKVTWQDENVTEYELRSPSLRRAKREITASLVKEGFLPVAGWSPVKSEGCELMRYFSRNGPPSIRVPTVR